MHSEHVQTVAHPMNRRRRRHRSVAPPAIEHDDRRALELAGWRTLLEYRENHLRDPDGTLLAVLPQWTAEAERGNPTRPSARSAVEVLTVTASDPALVWARLRRMAADLPPRHG